MTAIILIRGGGDLASGVALRLHHVGLKIVITELSQPLAVRRLVSFGEAVYSHRITVEDVTASFVTAEAEVPAILAIGEIPVLIDPSATILNSSLPIKVIVDARMTKRQPDLVMDIAPLVIGLGPGFIPGMNCHTAIETNRGNSLGRVYTKSKPEADTGTPDTVAHQQAERVLRAPANGVLINHTNICDHLEPGQVIAEVNGIPIKAPFKGVLRGLLHDGLSIQRGLKIGDLDPRDDPQYCTMVSDKSLAIGGGVLEAILSPKDLRQQLWS
ncbi:MAG: selenium-dependent molybdenum cofactor biosynthesis protein YqeB [Anaerolineales bacterium]|nr:selenium-dependent molybdenum cofactor biosynthesis protein YqeB [Anaerolineales bacterium]